MKYLGYVMELVVVVVACMWIHHASMERQSQQFQRQLIEFDLHANQPIRWEPRGGLPTQYQSPPVIYSQPSQYNY
jgi:energy-converting hydrogenase Eha subunit F